MQKRAIETRRKLLEAARALFAKQGFHGTRMDAVADRAGVNKERIYAYFENKEGLFAAVLQDAFASIAREEEAFADLREADIPRLPERLVDHYLRFHETHPYFWRLLSWENLEGGTHVHALRGIKEPALAHLRKLYHTGQERGVYDPAVSFETFMYVISAICFFFFSNRKTMSQTLALDLGDKAVRKRLVEETLRAVSFRANGAGARRQPAETKP